MDRTQAIDELTRPGSPFEFEIKQLYGKPCRCFKDLPGTLSDLFSESRSKETFIVYEDERLTFEEAWQKASQLGRALIEKYGLEKGDRVGIAMRNYPEWILSFMASTSVGCIAVAMNSLWGSDDLEYALNDSNASLILVDQERLDLLAECQAVRPDLKVLAVRCDTLSLATAEHFSDAIDDVEASLPRVDLLPEDDATILYTSGSTGRPKGVLSSHINLLTALRSWELDAQVGVLMRGSPFIVTAEDRPQPATLLGVPLFHATGSHAVLLTSYRAQRRLVCMYKWDVEKAAELIEREKISSFTAPSAITGDLVEYARGSNRDLSSLSRLGGGGAPRAPEQVKSIGKTFKGVAPGTGWGMTETNAIGTAINGTEYLERPLSSGRASAVLDLRIVDDAGQEVITGERGELQVKGTTVFKGYWNRPKATAEAFDGDWLRTGDVAYLDAEGYLFIVDRIKDLVIRGGENISCGGVEAALLEHPNVVEACVYGVPDPRLGEEVGATIYTSKALSIEELNRFLGNKLARFEIPRYYNFLVEPLPRTASGKIFKKLLREQASERVARGLAG